MKVQAAIKPGLIAVLMFEHQTKSIIKKHLKNMLAQKLGLGRMYLIKMN